MRQLFFVLIAGSLTVQTALAQTDAETPVVSPSAAGEVTAEQLDLFLKKVEGQTDLDEATKSLIGELTVQAQSDLKAFEAAEARTKEFEKRAADLESEKARLEMRLAQPVKSVSIDKSRSVGELESERVETTTRITTLEQGLKDPSVDPTARTAQRKAARDLLAELPAIETDLKQKLAASPVESESPLLIEARRLALSMQLKAVRARINRAQKELAVYDSADAVNLPQLRREDMTRDLNAARKNLEILNAEINRLRQEEAQKRAREAELAAMNAQPLLKEILLANQEIAQSEQEVRGVHQEDKELLQQVDQRLKQIQEDSLEAHRLDEEIGLDKMGIWLRKQRDELESLGPLFEQLQGRTERETEILFELYKREDELRDLADIEAAADALTARVAIESGVDESEFRDDAVEVLRAKNVNLTKLVEEYSGYTETLASLDRSYEQLRSAADEYYAFLDERILWVRSHLPLSLAVLRGDESTLGGVLSVRSLVAAIKCLAWDAANHPLMYISVAVLLAYLLIRRHRLSSQLMEVAKRASARVATSVVPTVHCLFLTVWLAMAWPGLMLFLSWRLHESTITSAELQIAAFNLARLASIFFLLEFIRQSIRPHGLAEAHFGWNAKTLRRLRRLLWSMIIIGMPIATTVACLHLQNPGSRRDGVERVLFVVAMILLSFFADRLLHPSRGALRQMKVLQNGGWFDRLDWVWYVVAIAVPVILAGFAYEGFYDTAVRLAVKTQRTAWLIVVAVYLDAFCVRWLMLRHRRLRIDRARQRMATAQEQTTKIEGGAPLPDVEEETADLASMSQQSQRLVSTILLVACIGGLYLVWADVIPAIRVLDRWPLWETMVPTMTMEVDESTGEQTPRSGFETHAVTVATLMLVAAIIFLTSTAARNVPGLLEMSILPKLPIDRSTAYAITSLTRYGLVLVGLILASKSLGIGWAKVQWLAAALTFGLGFGLQEIFANFVSGLIILFEQPVRVGDVVTIEGVSGVVNRIRIRATTIVDWDRKEYIVPNREFITGRLLNWTLSDKMNRIVINVGVAYGSNPAQVRSVIMQVLETHPNVLKDPAPLVTFEAFGDSSLNFVVRGYLPNLDNRLPTIHDLHSEIHDKLAQAGIEIPFPQRDLHLRTSGAVFTTQSTTNQSNDQSNGEPKGSPADLSDSDAATNP